MKEQSQLKHPLYLMVIYTSKMQEMEYLYIGYGISVYQKWNISISKVEY